MKELIFMTQEIFEKGYVNGYTGDLRTLFEIENQVHCYNYLKLLIVEKKALDITLSSACSISL